MVDVGAVEVAVTATVMVVEVERVEVEEDGRASCR
jgi:hypothetical protein